VKEKKKYLRDDAYLKAFGRHLKKLRKKAGLSQSELANECGMEKSQISRMERGVHAASITSIKLLAKALGCPPKKLLDFKF